ncbi:hypothetical protein [Runella slithyformis]|uniref:Uncharacterized protein n=1 Tax=Runella slithyformis (strain ATCC 29530 / DSM 19594 / LMG 11500 / NCIMB 11436 / LSU 4) TaxID=761193 RepID=A0A7U3ZGR2_RUNSL|nr:hypothetical protein [Runella slithyformis]AEI46924.1 hypothetical protein Runsl_0480 [Runella slithyformis DSM 19594]
MIASNSAQDQIATLIADEMPEQILHFKFSSSIQKRIDALIEKKKETALSADEANELEKYLMYDLLIGLAKARAYRRLHQS